MDCAGSRPRPLPSIAPDDAALRGVSGEGLIEPVALSAAQEAPLSMWKERHHRDELAKPGRGLDLEYGPWRVIRFFDSFDPRMAENAVECSSLLGGHLEAFDGSGWRWGAASGYPSGCVVRPFIAAEQRLGRDGEMGQDGRRFERSRVARQVP